MSEFLPGRQPCAGTGALQASQCRQNWWRLTPQCSSIQALSCSVSKPDGWAPILLRKRFAEACARAAAQASTIAEELLKTEYDAARLVFNRFQSAISFKPTITTVLSPDALEKEVEAGGSLDQYEVEGPDRAELLQDLGEFQLAAVRAACAPG